MAARKLHMPGARERIGGSAGAGAVAEGVVQNGNGVCVQPQGGSRYESRLASPIMQPLPLASRYVGAKHDTLRPASSALQSTWIQRLRPASPDVSCRELGHEVAHVWRDPQPALWSSSTPLLLAGPSKEPFHQPVPKVEQQQQQQQQQGDGGGDKRLMVREPCGVPMPPARNIESVDKGKGSGQVQCQTAYETKTAGQRKNDSSRTAQPQQVKPPVYSCCPKGFVAVEGGSSKREGLDSSQEGNDGPASQNPQSNGASGAVVTGFGPLRVILKPPAGNTMNKSLLAGSSSKLKGPVVKGTQAVDVPVSGSHFMAALDRNRVASNAGPQVMMTCAPGNRTHPTMNALPNPDMEIDQGRQIIRPGELFGGGFDQRTGYGSDNCRPLVLHQSQAAAKDTTFRYPGCSNGNRSAGGPLHVGEDYTMAQTMKGWYPAFSAIGSGVDMSSKGRVRTHPFGIIVAKEGRIDCGLPHQGKHQSRTNLDPSGKQVYVAKGSEARKAKEVVVVNKSYTDVRRSQQQASHLSPPFAPYQSTSHKSFGKQPQPFSPARSPHHPVEEEAQTDDEDGDASKERPEQTSLLTPLFGPPKPRQDGMEGTSSPWSSLFAAYKVPNQLGEPPNSNSSTGTLPMEGRLRSLEGQNPGNRLSGGPRASGNQDDESGGSPRIGAHPAASSAEARSIFDNQSSHFSSSPWPVDDGHNPTDDAGSAFHSQASHTPSTQVPVSNAVQVSNAHLKGQESSRYKYEVGGSSIGGSKDVSYKRARSRENLGSFSPGLRNSSGGMEGSGGARSTDEDDYARGPVKNSRQPPVPSFSGQKDDTSGSSPPSLPMGCNNSSDLCSPALLGAGVEDGGKSRAVHSRAPNVESESDGMHLGKRQEGITSTPAGVGARRRERSEPQGQNKLGLRRDPRESGARLCKDVETKEAQPMVGEAFPGLGSKIVRPNETGDFGRKQSRLRNSSDVVGEAGTSGPSKRSRHHPNQSSWGFQVEGSGAQSREQENGAGIEKPSSWLSRWLPVGSNGNGLGPSPNVPTSARPKDGHWNASTAGYLANGRTNCDVGFSGEGRVQANRAGGHVRRMDEPRNHLRDLSSKRAVFGLPPFPSPSAAAMALVGTAARKLGPLPSQRKGPVAMWPSVHLETTQTPEPQKSVRSSDLPTYVEQL